MEKQADGDTETWIYNKGKEWCGVVVGVVIPIPLVLPVCSREDRIVLRGDSVLSVTNVTTRDSGIMCGFFVNGLHGGGKLCTE